MFYYYGRKKKIAHLYPKPEHETIIEPFAGSAAYSLHGNNWERNVYLFDIDLKLIRVWKYLQSASEKDIRGLPLIKAGDDLSKINSLIDEERWLIGLHLNPGSSTPKLKVTEFNRWRTGQQYITENLHKIKHWKIQQCGYKMLESHYEATWFVDPPYESGGSHYRFGNIDYEHLAYWIKKLKGQVIVCEREDAKWLPFKSLTKFAGIGKRDVAEGIYVVGS